MDKKSAFQLREKAFEAEYFGRKEADLIDKLKLVFHKKIDRQSISEATRVTDEQLLDDLVELNLSGELMAAFQLLPVIEVAWADGVVDEREAEAVFSAAERHGIHPGSKAYALLETRLREGPSKDGRRIWFHYAEVLRKTLGPQELEQFRKKLIEDCWRVAQASGGLLNLVFTVSASERQVIETIERALTA
jgi:uncharacterized tellurite resistance protein B-like protein